MEPTGDKVEAIEHVHWGQQHGEFSRMAMSGRAFIAGFSTIQERVTCGKILRNSLPPLSPTMLAGVLCAHKLSLFWRMLSRLCREAVDTSLVTLSVPCTRYRRNFFVIRPTQHDDNAVTQSLTLSNSTPVFSRKRIPLLTLLPGLLYHCVSPFMSCENAVRDTSNRTMRLPRPASCIAAESSLLRDTDKRLRC